VIISQGPDLECDKKCENNGWCNAEKICQCPEGYMGQYCKTALCYPQCMNNGTCVAPGICRCPLGYQGPHCEGGNIIALTKYLYLFVEKKVLTFNYTYDHFL